MSDRGGGRTGGGKGAGAATCLTVVDGGVLSYVAAKCASMLWMSEWMVAW